MSILWLENKKIQYLVLLLGLVFSTPSLSRAGGKNIWEKKCQACHQTQKKGPMDAAHFASAQWTRFFKRKAQHLDLANIRDSEKQELLVFLRTHAADSDMPEVAGVR